MGQSDLQFPLPPSDYLVCVTPDISPKENKLELSLTEMVNAILKENWNSHNSSAKP